MSDFTYNPALETDRDKVRFHLNDVTVDNGPLPNDGNFQDAEIDGMIAVEGFWQRAVAAGLERLAAAWRKYPNLESDQFGLSRSHISRGYSDDAKEWRKQWGFAGSPSPILAPSNRVIVGGMIRADGYGDDAYVGQADE